MLALLLTAGCSGRPSAVRMADINPTESAGRAIEFYDRDGDGRLSGEELRAVPGILKHKQFYDLDSDGYVTREEIVQRLEQWLAAKLAFRSLSANVKLNGRPLSGVTVTLTPESYLGSGAKPASGVTNARGYASLTVATDDLPEAIKRRGIQVAGVYPGTYKITLTHPSQKLPDRDAAGLPLGEEVAADTVDSSIDIALSTR